MSNILLTYKTDFQLSEKYLSIDNGSYYNQVFKYCIHKNQFAEFHLEK